MASSMTEGKLGLGGLQNGGQGANGERWREAREGKGWEAAVPPFMMAVVTCVGFSAVPCSTFI